MLKRVLVLLASAYALCAPAAAQLEALGFKLARESGETIGAATACGLDKDRALATGQRIMALASDGPNASLEGRIRAVHADSAQMGAARQIRDNKPGCRRALQRFRQLEDKATINR